MVLREFIMRGECFLLLLPPVRTFVPPVVIVGARAEWSSFYFAPGKNFTCSRSRSPQQSSKKPLEKDVFGYTAPPGGLAYQSIFDGPQQSRLGTIEWVGGLNSVHCHRRFSLHFFSWIIFRFVFVSVKKKKLTLVESFDSRDFEIFYCRCI